MPAAILDEARQYLIRSMHGKPNLSENRHPWRMDWQFAALHSLRVETYALKILAREDHHLTEAEITLLRLAAILHDNARLETRENHAARGAQIAESWLRQHADRGLAESDIQRVVSMIAGHSDKQTPEKDYPTAVLKDADTLDEIGIMSVFMAANWLEPRSPFFFHDLRQKLIEREIPFCDKKLLILNTQGARDILLQKKAFVQSTIAQLTDEIDTGGQLEDILRQGTIE